MNILIVENIIKWIKDYFKQTGFAKGVVIGMSGGKDSLVVAQLCIRALGKDKVLGVIMPNGEMVDLSDAIKSCELLGINYTIINIEETYNKVIKDITPIITKQNSSINTVTTLNIPPRLRMTYFYAIAASLDYLVPNNSNLSETMVGYTTKWGDNVGDFAPLANFTKEEVCQIGLLLGLPNELVNKLPSDGLTGKSDEDKLTIKYANLDKCIRTGVKGEDFDTIQRLHNNSKHKRNKIAKFENDFHNEFNQK